jgi:hypothetical protein
MAQKCRFSQRFEEAMSLEDAEQFCQDLDGLAHVAVVPTLDDLNFLTVQIDQHGYHTYNLGAKNASF